MPAPRGNRNAFRHGHATRKKGITGTYRSWANMLDRCKSKRRSDYPRYGGRGIRVCRRWRDFARFLEDLGPRPPGLQLDRIDNSRGYEPGNCRWATPKQQANNRRPRRRRAPWFVEWSTIYRGRREDRCA